MLSRRLFAAVAARPAIRSFSSSSHKVDNPYSGELACEIPLLSEAEAGASVDRAADAQREWSPTTLDERVALCERFLVALRADADRVATEITAQMGKPYQQSLNEIGGVEERSRAMMALAADALAAEELPEKAGFARRITREPVGVVLVVAPWNFPLMTSCNTVIPAILAGNSVLIKQSARTPQCADHFASAFAAAGGPDGLVQALPCSHATVAATIARSEVGFVSFTGSVGGGRAVYRNVAEGPGFIDTTLELGGKDPAYVAPDADLDAAAETLVDGAFYNASSRAWAALWRAERRHSRSPSVTSDPTCPLLSQAGQSCCGIERVYVHEDVYDTFLERAHALVTAYTLGDPMDASTTMGPLAQADTPGFLHAQVLDAVDKGARLLCGGKPTTDASGRGRFFAPALVADCSHSMGIMMEESFGPVLGVQRVSSEEEAVGLMNDSPYGLTASVFTRDTALAERMAPNVQTGTFFMNRCDYLDPMLPWCGVKDTGKGTSLSSYGFDGVTRKKGWHFKLP